MKKVVRKLFFAWNEESEKEFLEEMSLKGYVLTKVQVGKYTFEKTEPRKVIYQFDFRGIDKIDEKEYLQIYEDAGWSLVYKYGGWYYFAREYTDEHLDLSIFNNNESKREKYKRLIIFLLITGFPLYYQSFIMLPSLGLSDVEIPNIYNYFRIIASILSVLHIFALTKIWLLYRKLRSNIKE